MFTKEGGPTATYSRQWAVFSDCEIFRYLLGRTWDASLGRLVSILLNPATATESQSDATNTRGEVRARNLGMGTNLFLNAFAFRSKDPQHMMEQIDPIGPQNDMVIRHTLANMSPLDDMLLLGWGNDGMHRGRDAHVLDLVRQSGVPAYALQINQSGAPKHPLYVGYDVKPVLMRL